MCRKDAKSRLHAIGGVMIFTKETQAAIILLFKGVLYKDVSPRVWDTLLTHQLTIDQYFLVVGLRVYIDESEGHAFLKQLELSADDDDREPFPTLIRKQQLTYHLSLMCVLLRKKLAEQDAAGSEPRLIMNKEQLREMMFVFMPNRTNEAKIIGQIDADINKMCNFGLLRELKGGKDHFEVLRIIKALVDADWLVEFDKRLEEYRNYGNDAA